MVRNGMMGCFQENAFSIPVSTCAAPIYKVIKSQHGYQCVPPSLPLLALPCDSPLSLEWCSVRYRGECRSRRTGRRDRSSGRLEHRLSALAHDADELPLFHLARSIVMVEDRK